MIDQTGIQADTERTTLALADWRRRISELYVAIRAETDPRRAWDLWRTTRAHLFIHHPQSPVTVTDRVMYPDLFTYDYDSAWRLKVRTIPVKNGGDTLADGGADGVIRFHAFAKTDGLQERLGRELFLYWIDGYGGGIFLPFRDGTSGKETYHGGRYLLDGIKGADLGHDRQGRLILDFNFAYHPSCYHSPTWFCPLAPPENRVERSIRAGERLGS